MPWQAGLPLPQFAYPASQYPIGTGAGVPSGPGPTLTERHLSITRRRFCQSTAALTLAAALLSVSPLTLFSTEARAQSVPMSDLMKPDALPDMALGDPKAPVTIIEYASMTCPHCAHFQETTFPELKKRYIDTGKVRYIFREFPLDSLAAAVFMLARCSAQDDGTKYFAFIDSLFRQQHTWAVERPLDPLFGIVKQIGFTKETFEACLSNQKILDGIEAVRQRAANQFKVESTPTFFVNGEKVPGAVSIEEMAKIIDPQLKG